MFDTIIFERRAESSVEISCLREPSSAKQQYAILANDVWPDVLTERIFPLLTSPLATFLVLVSRKIRIDTHTTLLERFLPCGVFMKRTRRLNDISDLWSLESSSLVRCFERPSASERHSRSRNLGVIGYRIAGFRVRGASHPLFSPEPRTHKWISHTSFSYLSFFTTVRLKWIATFMPNTLI